MTEIQNTTKFVRDEGGAALLLALGMVGETPDQIIRGMESAGQRQLVASRMLPTDTHGTDAEFEALGFVFGESDPGDPMFRPTTLPEGWSKRGSDHDMWSYVVDEHGRNRVSVFYKAAFYDRHAHMSLNTVYGYLRSCVYDNKPVVGDEKWATPAALRKAALDAAESAREAVELYQSRAQGANPDEYAIERLAEVRSEIARYTAIAEQYADGGDQWTGGKFRATAPDDARPGITAEVYDRLHDSWIGLRTGDTVLRGTRGEHYPIAQATLAETYDTVADADA